MSSRVIILSFSCSNSSLLVLASNTPGLSCNFVGSTSNFCFVSKPYIDLNSSALALARALFLLTKGLTANLVNKSSSVSSSRLENIIFLFGYISFNLFFTTKSMYCSALRFPVFLKSLSLFCINIPPVVILFLMYGLVIFFLTRSVNSGLKAMAANSAPLKPSTPSKLVISVSLVLADPISFTYALCLSCKEDKSTFKLDEIVSAKSFFDSSAVLTCC